MSGIHRLVLFMAPLFVAVVIGSAGPAVAADKFQFMKATENRVWRLNKETGEITVCTLEGERLICTTSVEAATPPPQSYAQMKAAEKAAKNAAQARREERQEKDLQILDRILAFFRELISLSKEQEAGK